MGSAHKSGGMLLAPSSRGLGTVFLRVYLNFLFHRYSPSRMDLLFNWCTDVFQVYCSTLKWPLFLRNNLTFSSFLLLYSRNFQLPSVRYLRTCGTHSSPPFPALKNGTTHSWFEICSWIRREEKQNIFQQASHITTGTALLSLKQRSFLKRFLCQMGKGVLLAWPKCTSNPVGYLVECSTRLFWALQETMLRLTPWHWTSFAGSETLSVIRSVRKRL